MNIYIPGEAESQAGKSEIIETIGFGVFCVIGYVNNDKQMYKRC